METNGTKYILPTFVKFQESTLTYEIFSTSNSHAGNYTLVTEFYYDNYPTETRQCRLDLDVEALEFEIFINSVPQFTTTVGFSP